MKEDDSRIRSNYGQEVFSTLRRMALNYLREEKTGKGSLKST
jgi:predicted transposase YbfD/YdcC